MSTKHYFNMYTTISKLQEAPRCKDSNAKCFTMTNSDRKMSREVTGTPLIPWTMDNMRKIHRKAFSF